MEKTPVLSICIASKDRPVALVDQVERLSRQTSGRPVEIVVVESSTTGKFSAADEKGARVHRTEKPNGVDFDYDMSMRLASGDYCWLFTDDDLADADAVERILAYLSAHPSVDVLLLDGRVRGTAGEPLAGSMTGGPIDPAETPVTGESVAPFFAKHSQLLTFIGAVVIRRSIWVDQDVTRYFGTEFVHVGVILERPLAQVAILATPALTVKYGVAHWEVRALRVWTLQWPRLVKMVVPQKDWPSYFPATFPHRVARLIEFRARRTLAFNNRRAAFPEAPAWERPGFAVVALLPVQLALYITRARFARAGSDTTIFEYDVQRSRDRGKATT